MKKYRIVETDNYGGDYPDEKFVNIPSFSQKEDAKKIADSLNKHFCRSRYWKVVEADYILKPGFEP